MTTYNFNAFLINDSAAIVDFLTQDEHKNGNTPISITFDYSFSNNWHMGNNGQVKVNRVINTSTNSVIEHNSLPIELQIQIRKICHGFLKTSDLIVNENIIPIFMHPIRLGNPFTLQLSQPAKIIPFPSIQSLQQN